MSSVMNEEFDDNNDKEMALEVGLELCDDDNNYSENKRLDDRMDTNRDRRSDNIPDKRTDKPIDKPFVLKKWNCCAMWRWDCECDTCAICRVQVMDACLRCQSDNRSDDCVVVWGECNHSFHNCCMSLWVQQNNRCPLCQHEWVVQRIGK